MLKVCLYLTKQNAKEVMKNIETIKLSAKWKVQFELMFNTTPKRLRKTIKQVNSIRSQAKLITELF
jgi:endonuclease III